MAVDFFLYCADDEEDYEAAEELVVAVLPILRLKKATDFIWGNIWGNIRHSETLKRWAYENEDIVGRGDKSALIVETYCSLNRSINLAE